MRPDTWFRHYMRTHVNTVCKVQFSEHRKHDSHTNRKKKSKILFDSINEETSNVLRLIRKKIQGPRDW